jgi:hypothetical protein
VPLVEPLPAGADARVAELSALFNETLGFTPNSVLTMQRRPLPRPVGAPTHRALPFTEQPPR